MLYTAAVRKAHILSADRPIIVVRDSVDIEVFLVHAYKYRLYHEVEVSTRFTH